MSLRFREMLWKKVQEHPQLYTETYLGPWQASMIKLYRENSSRLLAVSYKQKSWIVDAWQGPKYVPGTKY